MEDWLDEISGNPFIAYEGEDVVVWVDIPITLEVIDYLRSMAKETGNADFLELFYPPRMDRVAYFRLMADGQVGHGGSASTLRFALKDKYDSAVHIQLSEILPKKLTESTDWIDNYLSEFPKDFINYVIFFDVETNNSDKRLVLDKLEKEFGFYVPDMWGDDTLAIMQYLYLEVSKIVSYDDFAFDTEDSEYFFNYKPIYYKDFLN